MAQTCETTWQDALAHCRKILGEDDFELVNAFESPEGLIEAVLSLEEKHSQSATARILKGIKPHITRLQTFWGIVLVGLGMTNIRAACFWGATGLLLELASHSEQALTEVANYLNELGDKLKLFEIYNESAELEPETLEAFFNLLVDLVLNSVAAIRHFRKNEITTALSVATWQSVHAGFLKTLSNITAKVEQLQKFIEVQNLANLTRTQARLAQQLSHLDVASRASKDDAGMSDCNTLPFTRNHNMYGRHDLLKHLHESLDPREEQGRILRSAAIWGTGGIGKTQVALEYAHQALEAGIPVVIWIASASAGEASRSFDAAAARLNPPGYSPGNSPDQNKFSVLQALQKTDSPWLLIFDNVDDEELLEQNWPITGCGSILFTCRSELMTQRAEFTFEVPSFNVQESCELVLRTLRRTSVSSDELEALESLVGDLGGLALALDIIGRHMRVKKGSIKDFLAYYRSNRRDLMKRPRRGGWDPYYSYDIETVWKSAFDALSMNARKLLHILCLMASDKIPVDMLSPSHDVPGVWPFLLDGKRFEEVKSELLDLSLIMVNDDTGQISIHRVLQETYWNEMTPEERKEAFQVAWRLLRDAFPRRKMMGHLYKYWADCEKNIQNVLALQERFSVLREQGLVDFEPEYVQLVCHACRYLTEIENFVLAEKHLLSMIDLCKDRDQRLLAVACDGIGALYHRKACYVQDYKYGKMFLDITLQDANATPNDVANAFSGLGLTMTGLNKPEEGLRLLQKALACVDVDSEEDKLKFNIDRFLRNRGRAYYYAGNAEKAMADYNEAETWQTKIHGPKSQFHGETAYMKSKIAVDNDNIDLAFDLARQAHEYMSREQPTKVGAMSAQYQMGCIRMQQQRKLGYDDDLKLEDDALRYLRNALIICQMNESGRGDKGESARVKWQMSKIMKRRGLLVEAKGYLEDAEQTKDMLVETGNYAHADTEQGTYDAFIQILYR